MSIIGVILTLVAIGVVLWVVNTQIPMHVAIKKIINIVVILLTVVWVLNLFGVISGGPFIR